MFLEAQRSTGLHTFQTFRQEIFSNIESGRNLTLELNFIENIEEKTEKLAPLKKKKSE